MEDDVVRLQMEQAAGAYRAAEAQNEKAKKGVRSEELANAEALLAQSEKDVAAAEDSYERLGKLYKEGTISRSKYDDADRQVSSARTQLENARRNVQMMQNGASSEDLGMAESQMQAMQAQYSLAKLGLDNARIASPLSGRVVKVHTDQGNMAGQTTPLVTIVQDDPMLVRVPLPEKRYGELRERQGSLEAVVTLNALPGTTFSGRVSAISPVIDPASRTFTVEVELANARGLLRAGMYANVDLVLERFPDALLVPAVAVVERGGKMGVFTVHEDNSQIARFTETKVGLAQGDSVQVLVGLSDADRVVAEGNTFLEDGQTVVLMDAPGSP
jgi:RND family efflux transporter MFP subunit